MVSPFACRLCVHCHCLGAWAQMNLLRFAGTLRASAVGSVYSCAPALRGAWRVLPTCRTRYTLAHSTSGMLSKKGSAYSSRFQKIMNKVRRRMRDGAACTPPVLRAIPRREPRLSRLHFA